MSPITTAILPRAHVFADGIAVATYASVGQRTLVISPDDSGLPIIIIRLRQGGSGFKYTIPASDLPILGTMNAKLGPRGRWDAVMKDDSLFSVEAAP